MSDFADRPFAAGSLFGIRSFRVAAGGVLTGCVIERAWDAGLNEAGCHRPLDTYGQTMANMMAAAGASAAEFSWMAMQLSAQLTGRVLLTKRPKPPPRPPRATVTLPPHDAGTMTCTCGFYAYFDLDHNPHHHDGNVLGIIEGFGIVTVGSRGFRASKARIKALIGRPCVLDTQYDDIPWFPSVEAALAEFPLTPVERPKPRPVGLQHQRQYRRGGFIPAAWATGIRGTSWLAPAIHDAESKPKRAATDETPQERALRLRRERNTGPADQHGLDGHHRRKQ